MEFRRFNHDHTETPMTKTNMDLSELLAKHDQGDFLRSIPTGHRGYEEAGERQFVHHVPGTTPPRTA